jgi:TolB-like protein/Tfp pilus assembly protein PilF
MGIHSGPVHHVRDANARENISGVGINIAQRVMDCGDAGHILVSKRFADDLAQHRRWQRYLHELGDVEVKHGVVISLVNLYAETVGNPAPPVCVAGVQRTAPGATTRKGFSPVARAIFIIAVLLIALAIVSVIFAPAIMRSVDKNRARSAPQSSATASPSFADAIQNMVKQRITDELQKGLSTKNNAAESPATASVVPEKSIAVLPFDNLSDDKSNAYFAEGIQDEILTRLAKVADLKVISRTSTQHFKSAPDNLRDIAKQLGVMNILEGSVQKSNDQVRINVQLINAVTDAHLWADIYDRKLTDLFTVESEVAKTIADTLQAKLTGSEVTAMSSRPTEDPVAHDLFVQGRHFLALRRDDNLPRAIEFFHRAIARDPNYAAAYAGLSEAYILLPRYTGAYPSETRPQSRVAALKALELNPNLAEAHNALAKIALDYDVDFAESIREFKRAIELNPNYAGAHHWFSGALESLGRFEEAIVQSKLGTELDPFSAVNLVDQGRIYGSARRFPEAKVIFEKALAIDPAFSYAHWHYGEMLQASGDLQGAAAEYAKARTATSTPEPIALSGQLAAKMGRPEEARQALVALDELKKHRYVDVFWRALLYLSLGDKDQALQSLEQSYANGEGYEIGLIKVDPMLDSIRSDPRFQALVQKVRGTKEESKL